MSRSDALVCKWNKQDCIFPHHVWVYPFIARLLMHHTYVVKRKMWNWRPGREKKIVRATLGGDPTMRRTGSKSQSISCTTRFCSALISFFRLWMEYIRWGCSSFAWNNISTFIVVRVPMCGHFGDECSTLRGCRPLLLINTNNVGGYTPFPKN